jgi:hypothetical protein
VKTKTITSASVDDESDSRAYTRGKATTLPLSIRSTRMGKHTRREFEKGDLLAIPLCILWGAGLWLSYGTAGIFGGGEVSGADLSLLWSWPAVAARYLFGW